MAGLAQCHGESLALKSNVINVYMNEFQKGGRDNETI